MSWNRITAYLIAIVLCGCPSNSPESQVTDEKPALKVSGPLQILVLDDPEFATVLEREWSALSEHEVQFRNDSADNLLTKLREGEASLDTDVVIFPSPLIGELAEKRLLRSLPPELTSTSSEAAINGYNLGDVFSGVSQKEMRWDRRQLAISLGSPTPLLMTRTDLIPTPPTTWLELGKLASDLKSTLPANIRPLAQPLGDGWAARSFLSRSAAYLYQPSRVSSFFDYSNMKPRIATQPFVRALHEMKTAFDEKNTTLNPTMTFAEFMSGKTAMAITWPDNVGAATESLAFPMAIGELPGCREEFDRRNSRWITLQESTQARRATVIGHAGRMAAISRSAKNAGLAGIFLGWAGSAEQSSQLCPRSKSSSPFRKSHVDRCKNWCDEHLPSTTIAQYAASLEAALSRPESFVSIRIPGQDKYLKVLDAYVLQTLRGEIEPQVALNKVNAAWEDITNQLGREKQIAAYRHSLGISVE